ncbi:MAG: hypothetical protein QXF79_01585, partial [Ignisphaera sp.]
EPISNENFLLDVANVIRCVVLMAKLVKEGKEVDYWYRADEEYKLLILSTAREIYTSIENSLYING